MGYLHQQDLTGRRFGSLTVLKEAPKSSFIRSRRLWVCQCDCGRTVKVAGCSLVNGTATNCGCDRLRKKSRVQPAQGNEVAEGGFVPRLDFTGVRFGKLVVLRFARREKKNTYWECQCDCGRKVQVSTKYLSEGKTHCGCMRTHKATDLTGQRFGKLKVLRLSTASTRENKLWECRCLCGIRVNVSADDLKSGKVTSCGCDKKKARKGSKQTKSKRLLFTAEPQGIWYAS